MGQPSNRRRAPWERVRTPRPQRRAGGRAAGAPPTSARGHWAAPLAAAPALRPRRPEQRVARAAGEVHHVVQVELAAVREPVGGVPGVAARDGCGGRQGRSPPPHAGVPQAVTRS